MGKNREMNVPQTWMHLDEEGLHRRFAWQQPTENKWMRDQSRVTICSNPTPRNNLLLKAIPKTKVFREEVHFFVNIFFMYNLWFEHRFVYSSRKNLLLPGKFWFFEQPSTSREENTLAVPTGPRWHPTTRRNHVNCTHMPVVRLHQFLYVYTFVGLGFFSNFDSWSSSPKFETWGRWVRSSRPCTVITRHMKVTIYWVRLIGFYVFARF